MQNEALQQIRQDKRGRELDYVGFKFYRHQKLIRKSIKQNFCRAVARLKKQNATPEAIRRKTASWYGWAKHSNSNHLLQKLFYYDKDILQRATAGV
jgi:D-serine deaminase-like pyridoxal phosphate-dependent protein